MQKTEWIIRPVCEQKTREKILEDTIMIKFALICSEYRQETIIKFKDLKIEIVKKQGI